MSKDKYETMKLSKTERNIDQAIQRVYEAYGANLSAFLKNAQREAEVESSKKESPEGDGQKKARQ